VLNEGHGVPLGVVIAGANRHDMKLMRQTIESLAVERPEPTESRPQGMCLDKGYDYDEVRAIVTEFGFTAHSRARGEEAQAIRREAGWKRAKLRGGVSAFVDSALPSPAHPLGQETGPLSRLPAFRVWADHVPLCWNISSPLGSRE
jgi:hypothetical protein